MKTRRLMNFLEKGAPPVVFNSCMIVAALHEHYRRKHGWLSFAELRIGTGYGKSSEQRLDFWTMHEWPSKGYIRKAFEIKVSRSDFLAEMRQPLKRRAALLVSNVFYFVTPPGLINPEELPLEAGLMEIYPTTSGAYHIETIHEAPQRDIAPPTWRFLAAVTRRALRDTPPEDTP